MAEEARDAPAAVPPALGAGIDFTDPNSPLAPFYLRTVHLVAIGFVGFLFVVASVVPLWHTDVWGHARYGQWMVEHRAIPEREPFCPWWDGRVPFTQFYTLTQLPMYGAYALGEWLAGGNEMRRMAGGVEMLRLSHALLTAARFAVLLAVFVRAGRSWPVAVVGLVAVAMIDLSNLAVFRPQTFAQFGFAVLLVPLTRSILSRRALLLIPLLLVVWANGHGSYVVAFVLLAAVLLGRVVKLATDGNRRPWRDPHAARLAVALCLSVVAVGVLNPYGLALYSRTLALSTHPSLVGAITEWQPLMFSWAKGWHWIFMLSLALVVLTQLAGRKPMPPHHLVVLLLFGTGAALQNRFIIWWAMLVPWVLVPRWADLAARWPARLTPAASVPSLRKTAVGLLLLFPIFMWSTPSQWVLSGDPAPVGAAVSAGTPWPVARVVRGQPVPELPWAGEMAAVLHARYPDGRFSGTIMATPMQGDYLMWALAPDVPVTYAHIHLFHPDYWEELGVVGRGDAGWWDVLEKYRVNLLVVEADHARKLRDRLRATKGWTILLDETGDAGKPDPLTRQLVAIRTDPL